MDKPDVRKALIWAFDTFRANAVPLLALAAVVMVTQFIAQVAQRLFSEAGAGAFALLILTFVFLLLSAFAAIGVDRAALRTTQGHEPSFADMLTMQNLGRYILFVLAYIALTIVGLLLCILPAFFVIFFLQLGPFFVLDRGSNVGQAIRSSFEAIRMNIGPAAIMTILNVIVSLSGTLFFGVLTLLTLPFTALFTAHMYRQFNHEQIAP
ncbi:MAG: hypothetical protein Q7L55_10325 [Actinomycetota bacterium]|nr:hypothetical protein [Actinomycetota bacterium]